MCIGDSKHSPSLTPLRRTISSTRSVMCTISLRFLVSKTRYSVWLFTAGVLLTFIGLRESIGFIINDTRRYSCLLSDYSFRSISYQTSFSHPPVLPASHPGFLLCVAWSGGNGRRYMFPGE